MQNKSFNKVQQLQSPLLKLFIITLSAVLLTILCYSIIDHPIQNKQQQLNKSNQKYFEANSSPSNISSNSTQTIDKEWGEQQKKYNFTCIHGFISKNYQPSIINQPINLLSKQQNHEYNQNQKDRLNNNNISFQQSSNKIKQGQDLLDFQSIEQNFSNQNSNEILDKLPKKIFKNELKKKIQSKSQNNQQDKIRLEIQEQGVFIQPIKISLDYSNFQVSQNNKDKLNYIQQKLMPKMINTLRNVISIMKAATENPAQKKIIIPYGQCFNTKVPSLHSSQGVYADLILYITNSKQQANTLMWGVVCVRDYEDQLRPVAAQFNILDDLLDIENDLFNYNALIHEMIHILGFSRNNLAIATKSNTFIRKSSHDPSKSILTLLYLNNYAETYYNCTNKKQFEGIEIEDEEKNDPDNFELHFEKRYLMNDIMTSDISPHSMFSPLTLKVLESTGWYNINQDISIPYQYLLCSGCSVLTNFTSYYNNHTQQNITTPQNNTTPTPVNNSTQSKNITTRKNIHNIRQNNDDNKNKQKLFHTFGNPIFNHKQVEKQNSSQINITTISEYKQQTLNEYDNGIQNFCNKEKFNQTMMGCSYDYKYRSQCQSSQFSNGYSYLQALEKGSCIDNLTNLHNNYSNYTGEEFSNNSYCFISNIFQNSKYNNTKVDSTRCYTARCDTDLKVIHINIFNSTLTCNSDNQIIINPSGLYGQLNCPNYKQFCLAYDLRNYNPKGQSN